MIEIKNLSVSYGKKTVLGNLNQVFEPAKVHGIIGLNGAGKTTFFDILSGITKPTQGSILFNNLPVEKQHITYLETSNFFYSGITGKEYLEIFPKDNKNFDLISLNDLFQLPLDNLIESYSTGMKKKLALLAILRQEKPILIFDEPFNGLDLESNHILEIIIKSLISKGKTIFISSHIIESLINSCDEIHHLNNGFISKTYTPANFKDLKAELFGTQEQWLTDIISNSI